MCVPSCLQIVDRLHWYVRNGDMVCFAAAFYIKQELHNAIRDLILVAHLIRLLISAVDQTTSVAF